MHSSSFYCPGAQALAAEPGVLVMHMFATDPSLPVAIWASRTDPEFYVRASALQCAITILSANEALGRLFLSANDIRLVRHCDRDLFTVFRSHSSFLKDNGP
jgi:hypothetical protein